MSEPPRTKFITFSLYFLLVFGSIAILQPYLNLHFQAIGFTGTQIGMVVTISSLAIILFAPTYGQWFDRSPYKRQVLVFTTLLAMVTMALVPSLGIFLAVVLLYSINRVITTFNISAVQNITYQVGSSEGGRNDFGRIRLWGSLGFAFVVLLGGLIYEKLGVMVNVWIFIALSLALVIVLLRMPATYFQLSSSNDEADLGLGGVLKLILKNRFLWMTVVALALTDPVMDGVRSFEPVIMKNLGMTESVIGLSTMLSALFEVPLMLRVDRIIARQGYRKVLIFIFVFDLTRRMVVWLFPVGMNIFVMTILNCVSLSLRMFTMVSLVNQYIPKRFTTTVYAFFSVTLTGLGYMLSNALSGMIYDNYGGRQVFLMGALLCAVSLLLAVAAGKPSSDATSAA